MLACAPQRYVASTRGQTGVRIPKPSQHDIHPYPHGMLSSGDVGRRSKDSCHEHEQSCRDVFSQPLCVRMCTCIHACTKAHTYYVLWICISGERGWMQVTRRSAESARVNYYYMTTLKKFFPCWARLQQRNTPQPWKIPRPRPCGVPGCNGSHSPEGDQSAPSASAFSRTVGSMCPGLPPQRLLALDARRSPDSPDDPCLWCLGSSLCMWSLSSDEWMCAFGKERTPEESAHTRTTGPHVRVCALLERWDLGDIAIVRGQER